MTCHDIKINNEKKFPSTPVPNFLPAAIGSTKFVLRLTVIIRTYSRVVLVYVQAVVDFWPTVLTGERMAHGSVCMSFCMSVRLRNDLKCVGRNVKLHSLSHSLTLLYVMLCIVMYCC